MAGHQAEDSDPRSLWFIPPDDGESSRPTLTRERVVAEALTVISMDGAQALSMRGLARRLGVVPGALYRHVRSKEQLHDLVLDAVLAEVDCRADPALPSIAQVASSRAGCGRSWRIIPASPPCSRPVIRSVPPPWPWPRHSSRRYTRPACPAARPPWPSASSTTTPSASLWPTPPRPPSSALATARPDSKCTHSSAPCRPAASPPWPSTAPTPGPTTARNASARASTPSYAACRQPNAHPNPAAHHDQIKILQSARPLGRLGRVGFRHRISAQVTVAVLSPASSRCPVSWRT